MTTAAYQKRINQHSAVLSTVNRKYTILSYSRLLAFLLGIAITYFTFQSGLETEAILVGTILLVLFMYLIKIHTDVAEKKAYLQNLLAINELEIAVANGKIDQLNEGEEYMDTSHNYSYDLDIFGRASIFQYINRASTIIGKNQLANTLQQPPLDISEIKKRQVAIQELSDKLDWSQHFQAIGQGKMEDVSETDSLLQWLKEPTFYVGHKVYQILLWLMPTVFLLTVVAWGFGWLPPHFIAFAFFTELGIIGLNLKRTGLYQTQVGKTSRLLNKYSELLEAIESESFESDLLVDLQEKLTAEGQLASEAIGKLSTIVYYLDQRINQAAGLFLNGILLWDLQCTTRLEKWKLAHKDQMEVWFEVMAGIDSLISLGRFAFNHPNFCLPEVHEGDFVMDAKQLGHPLIPDDVRVNNDLDMQKGQFLIVTGANMAGKSTFLRTVGVNLILAMNGTPVCAEKYTFSPIRMITSVRATDSLVDNESYFYAELKRLKTIIDMLKEHTAFVIVDEMLRGTNSRDKQTGSRKFIEQMIQLQGVGLVATHDLALGKLSEDYPQNARNKRFEVSIEEDQLFFDYKLLDGISQNLNATFLMEKMGIM